MPSKTQIALFFVAVACVSAALGVNESIFNNYLSDTFDIGADTRGWLEFPRELPGLLVVVFTVLLGTLTVMQMGVVGTAVFAGGLAGMALWGSSHFGVMMCFMMILSAGMHLLQPVTSSIALSLGDAGKRGWRLAQVGVVGTLGMVAGTGAVRFLAADQMPRYRLWFLAAAAMALVAVGAYSQLHMPHLHQPRVRLVIRKRYWLYYLLEFLFGARKQIFLTFGFWVLVKEYNATAAGIAGLLMIAAIIGLGFKLLTGSAIDRFGPRAVMIADGIILALVCVGYGYAKVITGDAETAHTIACVCFMADSLLFALGTARSVYVSHLTGSPGELTSTLAMGISINHIASMILPGLAGMIWVALGYERVFAIAAVVALCISAVSWMVPGKHALRKSENEA